MCRACARHFSRVKSIFLNLRRVRQEDETCLDLHKILLRCKKQIKPTRRSLLLWPPQTCHSCNSWMCFCFLVLYDRKMVSCLVFIVLLSCYLVVLLSLCSCLSFVVVFCGCFLWLLCACCFLRVSFLSFHVLRFRRYLFVCCILPVCLSVCLFCVFCLLCRCLS